MLKGFFSVRIILIFKQPYKIIGKVVNMNPVLWILILLAAVLLWFIISFIFVPLGRLVLKKWDNVMGILNDEEEKENKHE